MEETVVPGENHRPVANYSQTLSHNVVSSTPRLKYSLCMIRRPFFNFYVLHNKVYYFILLNYLYMFFFRCWWKVGSGWCCQTFWSSSLSTSTKNESRKCNRIKIWRLWWGMKLLLHEKNLLSNIYIIYQLYLYGCKFNCCEFL